MRVNARAIFHRILTYPALLPVMLASLLIEDKRAVLDAFYFVRGLPHGYTKGNCRIAFYKKLAIFFPPNEDPAFDDVWLRDVYYPYKPRKGDTVIDVGAHMGFFTLKIADKVNRIIAVEPDPFNYELLKFNIQSNGLEKKATPFNFALSKIYGTIFLDRSGYGFGRTKTTTHRTSFQIKTKSLDGFVQELGLDHVDFIKIDTEGSELDILEGAAEVMQKYEPHLLIAAYHFPNEHIIVANYLKKHGYTVFCYSVPLVMSNKKETYLYARAT